MTVQDTIKPIVRGTYDLQKLRIQTGNRIAANFRAKLGLKPSEKEDEKKDAKKILKDLRARYKLLTDGIVNFPKPSTFKGDGVISTFSELCLIAQYIELEIDEVRHFSRLGGILREVPIFVEFLDDVVGIGPAMAGVIVSEIDITKSKYASSLWAYCGLDVASDGRGRSRRKEHQVLRPYIDKDGKEAERQSITFSPFLKTKLIGVLGPSFIKCGSPYADIYYGYKHRLENNPAHDEKSKGHRHNMAIRYMVKMFLIDL